MEWLKNRSLKQSFFIISTLFLCVGLLLAAISFLVCAELQDKVEGYQKYEMSLDENGKVISSYHDGVIGEKEDKTNLLLNILQFALPIFFVVLSLALADITFYRIKLKRPLSILQSSAERIQHQDLDFSVEKCANDELGMLCSAFETMRMELQQNNQELWGQMEERKRLNAAFSHDLRNPVTVLKGCANLLQKRLIHEKFDCDSVNESLALIAQYTVRIENYVEAMTMAQKLENWKFYPKNTCWSAFSRELEQSLLFLADNTGKEIKFSSYGKNEEIFVDKAIIQNVSENLVNNALRYTKTMVSVKFTYDNGKVIICVSDDGTGFSPIILRKGISPFLRDEKQDEKDHFGMGLYICSMLCKKHGGNLKIENLDIGAKVTACFHILSS